MIGVIKRRVPAIPRSQYQIAGGGRVVVSSEGANVNSNSLPFEYSVSGDLILNNKKLYFNSEYVDDAKVITWDEAVATSHSHSNKNYLDAINQDLSVGSDVTFQKINYGTVGSNIQGGGHLVGTASSVEYWRCRGEENKMDIYSTLNVEGTTNTNGIFNAGVLNMNNNNLWAVSNIDFNMFDDDGEMKWNTISNVDSNGLATNCHFKVGGSFEMFGTNRDFYSYNDDLNIIHYRNDWTIGSKLSLTDTAVVTDNLTVKGAFNCYELVANKVRATNGLLYVTDSDVVKYIYDGGAVIEWTNNIFQLGDILLMQNFTGESVKSKKIKITYVSSGNPKQCNYEVWNPYFNEFVHRSEIGTEYWPVPDDYFVKVDSEDESRRDAILLNPYDGGYIDFYKGVGDGVNKAITTSLGNLDHLGKAGVSGNGLYTDNAFITGEVNATKGNFTGEINIGNGAGIWGNVDAPGGRQSVPRFYSGSCKESSVFNAEDAADILEGYGSQYYNSWFVVDDNGYMTCNNADISGTINATDATISKSFKRPIQKISLDNVTNSTLNLAQGNSWLIYTTKPSGERNIYITDRKNKEDDGLTITIISRAVGTWNLDGGDSIEFYSGNKWLFRVAGGREYAVTLTYSYGLIELGRSTGWIVTGNSLSSEI